ncbi:MAG: hypothetical protein H6Q73_970 [Firmicutes bacterium]|nr:hypothetical protein [Bacillota bacterium]
MSKSDNLESRCIEHAVEEFTKGGLYCSEAILKAFSESYDLGLTPELYKIATAFGVGLGGAKCCCGCVTGSAIVLSLVTGRNTAVESEDLAFSVSSQLHDEFKKRFKATCCRVLTSKVEWLSPEHLEQCACYVRGAAEITTDILKTKLNKNPNPVNKG